MTNKPLIVVRHLVVIDMLIHNSCNATRSIKLQRDVRHCFCAHHPKTLRRDALVVKIGAVAVLLWTDSFVRSSTATKYYFCLIFNVNLITAVSQRCHCDSRISIQRRCSKTGKNIPEVTLFPTAPLELKSENYYGQRSR